ncbi:hypothetical protein [Tabrizicola sp.]|uniref:hypothetical protein n=1 Tax=Tabrizicola sp. TaxID=2005166 RepID=UPI00286B9819|nr:hypothetical protein [Tabrizicola sp.]
MSRILFPALLLATPAVAHEGLHHHPHGVEHGWLAVVALGALVAAGVLARRALAAVRARK